ncbi:hypothetical protein E2C01_046523 [Portunus trituberculatus]|uniref:Uncharacterized protein n=1 Tax=Portunus trituberculatus TaxID=210409 RepID=A0A5B7G534_PORTR|nr:hypothetical protein [Portunus trituberculatus]
MVFCGVSRLSQHPSPSLYLPVVFCLSYHLIFLCPEVTSAYRGAQLTTSTTPQRLRLQEGSHTSTVSEPATTPATVTLPKATALG